MATPTSMATQSVASAHRPMVEDNPSLAADNPLNGVTQVEAQRFHKKYRIPVERDVIVRGVLALRSQVDIKVEFEAIQDWRSGNPNEPHRPIELRVGEHKYTRLESEVLYRAFLPQSRWETLRNLSRLHWLLIVACIFAAMTQGWDQAAMAGASIEVMKALGIDDSDKSCAGAPSTGITRRTDNNLDVKTDRSAWLLGVTIGVPFFAGAILGLIITDPINRLPFGRRGAICVAGIFSFISVVGSASVHKWEHLLVFRILLGAGMAGKASIVPILLSETSPKDVRGFLLVFWQLFVAFGLAAGSVANMAVYRLDVHSSWRYMFISAFIPALLLLSLILFSPESPRWLLKESGSVGNLSQNGKLSKNDPRRGVKIRKAYKSLVDLRGEVVPILAAGELFLMHTRLIDEQRRLKAALDGHSYTTSAASRNTNAKSPFRDVIQHISWRERVTLIFFRSGYTNRAHRAAAAVMISQQLCGINLIAFMSDHFFKYSFFDDNPECDNSEKTSDRNITLLGASLGLMLLNFIATIPALFVIDITDGRRRVLNWTFPVMAGALLMSAVIPKIPNQPKDGYIAGHYIFLVVFIIAYSVGEGPAAFVISAEVFPLVNRELGMSLAVCWNFMGAGLLAVLAPWLLDTLGQFGVLLLFAGTNLLAWFLCFWLVPSTGKEDLEEVFEQLDITTRFMFIYTLKTISRRFTQPVEWCLRLTSRDWKECGYPERLESPRKEWEKKKRAQRSKTTHPGPPDSSCSSEDEVDEIPSDRETDRCD